ncbi:unnamed protein product [Protopolystoma xenopodis]|uniref:Uncharacterized protein n=1 Tax=Protopolystoma xenopodis TaxID=117903 RepID=A0A3S5AXG1_9PLAT|nr:unnamed protein product [Protopolystoma xenopodis]
MSRGHRGGVRRHKGAKFRRTTPRKVRDCHAQAQVGLRSTEASGEGVADEATGRMKACSRHAHSACALLFIPRHWGLVVKPIIAASALLSIASRVSTDNPVQEPDHLLSIHIASWPLLACSARRLCPRSELPLAPTSCSAFTGGNLITARDGGERRVLSKPVRTASGADAPLLAPIYFSPPGWCLLAFAPSARPRPHARLAQAHSTPAHFRAHVRNPGRSESLKPHPHPLRPCLVAVEPPFVSRLLGFFSPFLRYSVLGGADVQTICGACS